MLCMLSSRHESQIFNRVIERIAIDMMDEVSGRYFSVDALPDVAMKQPVAVPKIDAPMTLRMLWTTAVIPPLKPDCLAHGRIISP